MTHRRCGYVRVLKRISASLFWDTEFTVGFISSSPLVLRQSDKVKTLSPTEGVEDAEDRDWGTWKDFNSVSPRVLGGSGHNPPEGGGLLKEVGDAKIVWSY